ncbi:MAG: class I SAM-dependent methyltransferase, partial [Candidatus Delongbacteria bacterium]
MPVEEKEKKLFDEIALKYSCKDTYPVSAAARRFQFNTLLNLIPKDRNTEFDNIIEIGCGNGAGAEYLKDLYSHYTGIDISSKLIQIAKKNYASENAEFFCSDILQFEEKTKYDLIVCVGVLHHLPDLKKYLKKISDMGHKNSIFLFLEPQSLNPMIQFMRMIRKLTDPS